MMAAEPAAGDAIGMDVADGMEKLSSNVMNCECKEDYNLEMQP